MQRSAEFTIAVLTFCHRKPIICGSARDFHDNLPDREGVERYVKRKSDGKLTARASNKLLDHSFFRTRSKARAQGAYIMLEQSDRAEIYESYPKAQKFLDSAQFDTWGEVRQRIFELIEEEGSTWIRARDHRKSFLIEVKPEPEDRVTPPDFRPVTQEILARLIEEEAKEANKAALAGPDGDNDNQGEDEGSKGKGKKRTSKGGSLKKSNATSTPAAGKKATKATTKMPSTIDEMTSTRPQREKRYSGSYKFAAPLIEEEHDDVLPFAGGQESESEFASQS